MLKTTKILLAAAFLINTASSEVVWVRDHLAFNVPYRYNSMLSYARIEVGVWPVASNHNVGAVYTYDGWETVQYCSDPMNESRSVAWCYNETNAYGGLDEVWRMVLDSSGPLFGQASPADFEYAVFVAVDGIITAWDNNNGANYQVSVGYTAAPMSFAPTYASWEVYQPLDYGLTAY